MFENKEIVKKLESLGKYVFTAFGLFFMILGVWIFNNQQTRFNEAKENWTPTQAVISKIETYKKGDGKTGRNIFVTYTTEDGTEIKDAKFNVSTPSMQMGQTIEIYYNPADPEDITSLEFRIHFIFLFAFGGLGLLFFIIGIVSIVKNTPDAQREEALNRERMMRNPATDQLQEDIYFLTLALQEGDGTEIDIHRKQILNPIGTPEWDISIGGKRTHLAKNKLFSLLPEFSITEIQTNRIKYVVKKKIWPLIKSKFSLTRWDGEVYEFVTEKIWKSYFSCRVGQDLYEIFWHKGRKYSIYKNNVQIALWDKEKIALGVQNKYKLIADAGSDYELLISFCLIFDYRVPMRKKRSIKNIDYGQAIEGARPFDPTWRPKRVK